MSTDGMATELRGFSVRQGKKFEPEGNIFMQDYYNMGITIGLGGDVGENGGWNRILVMSDKHNTQNLDRFYIVNEVTGESISIEILPKEIKNDT